MRVLISAVVITGTAAALVWLATQRMPWKELPPLIVARQVPVEMKGKRTVYVKLGTGEVVPREEEFIYTVMHSVTEELMGSRVVTPTNLQLVQFWVITGVAVVYGLYAGLTLVFWARDKYTRKRDSADTRDTRDRMSDMAKFGTGILIGIVGAIDTGNRDVLGGGAHPQVDQQDTGHPGPHNSPALPAPPGTPENAPAPPEAPPTYPDTAGKSSDGFRSLPQPERKRQGR